MLSIKASASEVLTLRQAEATAVANDPLIKTYLSSTSAYQDKAVAADTLPDPKLKLGLMNFPTDSFRRDQEPMTQIQIGIQQAFPRGDSLAIKSRRMRFMADKQAASGIDQSLKIRRQVRHAWLEMVYWLQARKVVNQNRDFFKQVVNITRSQYASGRHRQQDVVRAQLELGMLDDRIYRIETNIDQAKIRLGRLVGRDISHILIEKSLPDLPTVKSRELILRSLNAHPVLRIQQAMLSASEEGVALARQNYKPAWMLDLTYGAREGLNPNGSERANFISAMVVMDIPLFTSHRQDKYLTASQAQRQAVLHSREDRIRDLEQQLDDSYSSWRHLLERQSHYQSYLVPAAKENADDALQAYQNSRGDFTSLMQAKITEIEMMLNALRIRIDSMKIQANLLYLSGE